MNWPMFAIFAYLMLVIEVSLRSILPAGVAPCLMLIMLVYVGMFAAPMTVAWSAIALGLLLDLTRQFQVVEIKSTAIMGPNALGFLVGAYVLIHLRAMVFRGPPLTMAILVLIVGIFTSLVTVFALRMRGWVGGDALQNWSASGELVERFFQLLYSALAALPLGYVLSRCAPLLGFHTAKGQRRP